MKMTEGRNEEEFYVRNDDQQGLFIFQQKQDIMSKSKCEREREIEIDLVD
jgi:hypothetical protein